MNSKRNFEKVYVLESENIMSNPQEKVLTAKLPETFLPKILEVNMGKGDRRSKRGKIFRSSYGKTRLKKTKSKK